MNGRTKRAAQIAVRNLNGIRYLKIAGMIEAGSNPTVTQMKMRARRPGLPTRFRNSLAGQANHSRKSPPRCADREWLWFLRIVQ